MKDLTKSERAILVALNGAPEKRLTFDQARRAAKLTPRGFWIVLRRLEGANRVGQVGGATVLTITFGGLRAIGGSF